MTDSENKNIFFACYGGGHAAMMMPVIKRLSENNRINMTILALTTGYDYLTSHGIKCKSYSDFTNLISSKSWEKYGTEIIGDESSYTGMISYNESLAYHGINFYDLVEQYGEYEALSLYNEMTRQSFYPINFMIKLLSFLKPDLVIATNSPRSEKAAIVAARKLNIASICMVDLFALQEYQWIACNNYANKVFVLNEEVKNFLVIKGRNPDDILVTGNPAFDRILSIDALDKSRYLKKTKYTNDKINILYASQPEPAVHPFNDKMGDVNLPRSIENVLRYFVSDKENFRLVVRYHPSENIDFTESKNCILSPNTEDLHSMLHCMDLVIVTSSTVGLEASIANIPVISVDRSIFTSDAPYSQMGISIGLSHESMLPLTLNKYTELKINKAHSKNHCSATENVCQNILKIIKNA